MRLTSACGHPRNGGSAQTGINLDILSQLLVADAMNNLAKDERLDTPDRAIGAPVMS